MKLFTAAVLFLLNFTSILDVVAGKRGCRVCAELQQMNSKLAVLQQIDTKLEQINATLAKLLASGGTSGAGSSSGEFAVSFLPFLFYLYKLDLNRNKAP